jgi:hypothetical protein
MKNFKIKIVSKNYHSFIHSFIFKLEYKIITFLISFWNDTEKLQGNLEGIFKSFLLILPL